MLVLLIIFMVAAPLSTVDLPVDLPASSATPQKKPDKPTYVSIKPDLTLAIGEDAGQARRAGRARSTPRPTRTRTSFIFLRADRAVAYGDLMDVMEILRAGGYTRIKLVALEGVAMRRAVARRLNLQSPEGGLTMSDLDLEQKPSRWLWNLRRAWLRLRCISAAWRWRSRICGPMDGDEGLGANGVEIAFEMASPKVTDENLPPGPETDASLASPQLAEQKAEVKETELPKDTPTETEDPDRIVTPERVEEAEGRRSQDRRGADRGLDGVGRAGSDLAPDAG